MDGGRKMKTCLQYDQYQETGVREECGVFGIYDFDGNDVASSVYYGLCSLQHRGQESCGIVVSDTKGDRGNIAYHKDLGLVSEVESDMSGIQQREALQERMHSLLF